MLLFKKAFHSGLTSGAITLTFRRWQKPHVKPGGRYRCHPIGVLKVEGLKLVTPGEISAADALAAGFESLDALLEYMAELGPLQDDTQIYRVELHYAGDGDRIDLALENKLSPEDIAEIRAKLARMDKTRSWTTETLSSIQATPRTAASKLAAKLGRETAPFKADVVKLKKLGLTQSFEVGYEISPRGKAFLEASDANHEPPRSKPSHPARRTR